MTTSRRIPGEDKEIGWTAAGMPAPAIVSPSRNLTERRLPYQSLACAVMSGRRDGKQNEEKSVAFDRQIGAAGPP